jgi:hypothetical protein
MTEGFAVCAAGWGGGDCTEGLFAAQPKANTKSTT